MKEDEVEENRNGRWSAEVDTSKKKRERKVGKTVGLDSRVKRKSVDKVKVK